MKNFFAMMFSSKNRQQLAEKVGPPTRRETTNNGYCDYDTNDRLVRVVMLGGAKWSYEYDDQGRITEETKESLSGCERKRYMYDDQGRITEETKESLSGCERKRYMYTENGETYTTLETW